jgi:hypothetical protein
MLYAIDGNGERIPPVKHAKALCPGCKQPVLARCGDVNVDHWAHVNGCECDPWHEPETQWHITWKMQFEEHCREVVLPPHRADVCATRVRTNREARTVVELQHSPIEPAEIREREVFYFDQCNHMVWVIDARDITQNFEFGRPDTLNGGATIRTTFRWKWFRKSWGTVHVAPRYLDFGDELWKIEQINQDGTGGCRSYSYHEFLSDFEEARGHNLPVKWRPTSTGGFVYRFGRGNVLMFRNKKGSYQFRTHWDGGHGELGKRFYSTPEEAKRACEPHLGRLMRDQSHLSGD